MKARRALAVVVLLAASGVAPAAEEVPLMEANIDLDDKPSLQRGAHLFVNYCLSCHSARYMRYNRMAADLGIPEELAAENLMFAADKLGDTMTVAMPAEHAEQWFTRAPPDLSVAARARGPDWIYTYLLSFYKDDDPARLFGVNNLVLQGTTMPAVLAELQGVQVLAQEEGAEHGAGREGEGHALERLVLEKEGTMNPAQYRRAVSDLVAFLTYVSEPAQLVRYRIGVWVLLFVAFLFVITYALYKEYWKDVH